MDEILPHINGDGKRMIKIIFILKQLFKMLNLPDENIPMSKSKNTLDIYQMYWNKILLFIGDQIRNIIKQQAFLIKN